MEIALLSALFLCIRQQEHFAFLPLESLGWAGMAVWRVSDVFHIASGDATLFALALSLKAAGEAAVDAGLAAIAWWAYAVLTREVARQRRAERYGICLLLVTCGLGIANKPYFWRSGCSDCFAPHGIPFAFFHEGGFGGGEGFVWTGILENTIVVLIVALVSGFVWNRLAVQTPV